MHFSENSWKSQKNQANCIKIHECCTKTQKKSLKVGKHAPREAKNGSAGVKSELRWTKWAHLEPLLPTLAALLATWGVLLRMFMHFYEVFVNNCGFFLKSH